MGLPWQSLTAFVRLVSNPRVFERPVTVAEAWSQAEAWLDARPAWVPLPTVTHRTVLARMLAVVDRPDDVPDAELAALAIEHGLALVTADHGFARFPGLRWELPLHV